ncbi:MAG: GlxA family transcriptional regulator [Gammaproteobacteria bacterium]|jgi:transcriptional regulator GlxA family with amidase domain|nr:GlxA family transcriptional regulator [Gammaproteobacteria bacterium]
MNVTKPIRYAFLQVSNYSMITFSSAVAALRGANYISGKDLYQWEIVTMDGNPVRSSVGFEVGPTKHIDHLNITGLEALIVCGGTYIDRSYNKQTLNFLRKIASTKTNLGSTCTGSYLLAAAGLLDGYQCTIHWENLAGMREEFPNILMSSNLFAIDRDRFTCSGGNSSLDMMLQIIGQQQGPELAAAVSEMFIMERIRDHHDTQRIPLRLHLGNSQPKLIEAVALMEANLEETISLDDLAQYVGVSRRQLERLFQKHLKCVPSRYYLELRLNRARQLLLQTNLSIIDVSLACGFVSAPHFSKCYRDFFGIPPREERRRFAPGSGSKLNASDSENSEPELPDSPSTKQI